MKTASPFDFILRTKDALISDPMDPKKTIRQACDIGVKEQKIVAIEKELNCEGSTLWDADDNTVLPGIIDSQVHFRDPGASHKEDFASGSKGAVLGGITAVFDMPNTKPNTSTPERFLEKLNDIKQKSYCDFALFAGATNDNSAIIPSMEKLEGCCGVKIFMGSSTGDLLVSEDEFLEKVLKASSKMISVHCEDEETLINRKHIAVEAAKPHAHPEWRNVESALKATQRIVGLAKKVGRKIHTLHITTAEELEFLQQNKETASVEILPQHMFFSAPSCYDKLGTLAQMNPPIREARHQEAIKKALQNGLVDVVASDHAPHTLEEKSQTYPKSPSGLVGVQTILPIMLNFVNEGLISLERLVHVMSINPAQIFKVKGKGGIYIGQDADFSVVDMNRKQTITNDWIVSRSGWTPYHNVEVQGWPVATIIRGEVVMENGQVLKQNGQPLHF